MAIINGSDLRMYIGGAVVAKETESSISFTAEGKEVRHKDLSNDWTSVETGKLSCEIRGSALYASSEDLEDIFTAFAAGTNVAVLFEDPASDTYAFSGNFKIMSLEQNATDGENATYSWTGKNDGAVTRVAVST